MRRDQNHACIKVARESLFERRPPALRRLYGHLVRVIKRFGDFREEAVKPDVIFFKTTSSFLSIKVKKDNLVVTFFLDHLEDTPPVFKHLQTSRRRFAHLVAVDEPDDITPQLKKWMKQSYKLIATA